MAGDQRPCCAGAGALIVKRDQCMKSVQGDEIDLGQVDYQCAAVGCQLADVVTHVVDVRGVDLAADRYQGESGVGLRPDTGEAGIERRAAAVRW